MKFGSIAIVGASCRFPAAPTLGSFWSLLIDGKQAIGEVGEARWATGFYGHPRASEPGKSYTWAAGLLDQINGFDPGFFGISAREALQMDPQQRLLLELASEALDDGGLVPQAMRGTATGVYVGASTMEYSNLLIGDLAAADAYFMTGTSLSILSNRISYIFDLRGPSLTVDTACSSSLVAVHLACEDLRRGKIDCALVGGVNLLLSPYPFVGFSRAGMLSKSGRCFSFDARADGYVRGEGGGVVVLKPLAKALADGDRIRGVILGSGTNSDGRTVGLSLPSRASQASLLRSVYSDAGIDPGSLGFVEAHGTGTAVGDPIEAGAIGDVLGQGRTNPLPIGSVKTNIGHLEPAAGMAGFLKSMLSLQHRILPRSLDFETPNPRIDFEQLNIAVAGDPVVLDAAEPVAGVNSFGFGGTNAHVILGTAPPQAPPVSDNRTLPPLLLSAATETALRRLAGDWAERLDRADDAEVPGLVRAAARRRGHLANRLVALDTTNEGITTSLKDFASGGSAPNVVADRCSQTAGPVFVFSGNGAQWAGMGRDAYVGSVRFREALDTVDGLLSPLLGWSVVSVLETITDAAEIAETDIAQPLIFAVQVAVVEALKEWGVVPAATLGHSIGEIAAAWAAGALSLADAAFLVVSRSRQQQRTAGAGRMAVLGLTVEEARVAFKEIGAKLEIAGINASRSLTIAGPLLELKKMEAAAKKRRWVFTFLDLDYAFHTSAMDVIKPDLLASLAGLRPLVPGVRFISTVTASPVTGADLDAEYWWRNIREPVQFGDAVRLLVDDGATMFLEIGPHPVLQSYLRDALHVAGVQGKFLGTLTRKASPGDPFPRIAASCHVAGGNLSASDEYAGPVILDDLPIYPWQREPFWFRPSNEGFDPAKMHHDRPLLGYRLSGETNEWKLSLDTQLFPWLEDHKVDKSVVVPAAAMVATMFAVAETRFPNAATLELRDLEILRAITLDPQRTRMCRVRLEADGGCHIESHPRLSDDPWSHNATAFVDGTDEPIGDDGWPTAAPAQVVSAEMLYQSALSLGLDYGPEFRTVESVGIYESGDAIVTFRNIAGLPGVAIDPRLLDGALQGVLAVVAAQDGHRANQPLMLPWRFDRLRWLRGDGRQPQFARITLKYLSDRTVVTDIVMADRNKAPIASIRGCALRAARINRRVPLAEKVFSVAQRPAPLFAASVAASAIDGIRHAILPRAVVPAEVPPETVLLIDGFIASAAIHTLSSLIPLSTRFSIPSAIETGVIAPQAGPLVEALLSHLQAHGCANEQDGLWQMAPVSDLPDPVEIWRSLYLLRPDLGAITALIAGAAARLTERLTNDMAALESPLSLRDQFLYAGTPSAAQVDALTAALVALGRNWPIERPLRVLELGAGGGMLARRLLPRLMAVDCTIEYIASDPDPDATHLLREELEAFDCASVVAWDPRATAQDDAVSATTVDVIISAGFLTFGHADQAGLQVIRRRLAAGGVLMAVEPEPNPLWDFVFGQAASWWGAGGASPLRSMVAWAALLSDSGFGAVDHQNLGEDPWPFGVVYAAADSQREPTAAAAPEPRGVVLVGDREERLLQAVGQIFSDSGVACRVISRDEVASGLRERVAGISDQGRPALVIALPPALAPIGSAGDRAIDRLSEVAAIAAQMQGTQSSLWLVTGSDLDPAEAAVTGFGRVLANEMSPARCRRIILDSGLDATAAARAIFAEFDRPDHNAEVSWSSAGRFAARLRRGLGEDAAAAVSPVRLVLPEQGSIDSLCWESLPKVAPGPGEIVIKVEAAGLNFRDVMWAMGLLPEEALVHGFSGATLGMECAGTVTAVGAGVTQLAPGDRVMAFASASFASETVTRAECAIPLPDGFSFADGTTVPVAFLTVLYSLGKLAGLKAGETVLIHGAAGAVGLAAVQYAQHVGAKVIGTAGSEIKRALLRNLGVEHVLDSRSLRFADAVLNITGGKGVDVVLNSLSGDAMRRSLELMKPFGRFLELGKRDFYMNSRIGLRPVRHNVSYFAIDADELVAQHPDIAAELLDQLRQLFAEGALHPLPHMTLPFSEVVDAFRLMRGSGHIGKIVLVPDPDGLRVRRPDAEGRLRSDRTYLVTGGLTGFGRAAGKWLVKAGARHLVLLGRRGMDTPGAAETLEELRQSGAEDVRVFACDVADSDALSRVLAEIRQSMPSIGGVIHGAMVVEDGLISGTDRTAIARVMTPKLVGAENLDRLTRLDPIELFLLFSSATTLLGSPGQGNYVAANAALEGLARQRRAAGLPALAVGWGPIEDTGYLADRKEIRDALSNRLGAVPLKTADALGSLPSLLASPFPALAFAEVIWSRGRGLLPIIEEPMFGAVIRTSDSRQESGSIEELLANKSAPEILEILHGILLDEVSHILRVPREKIEIDRPLPEIGMDSLMAVELKLGLERRLNIEVPALVINDGLTLRALAGRIFGMLAGDTANDPQATIVSQHTADIGEARRIVSALEDDPVAQVSLATPARGAA